MAFPSSANLLGPNPGLNIFVWEGGILSQITNLVGASTSPSIDGSSIAFVSSADPMGLNPDQNYELFLWNSGSLVQLTQTSGDGEHGF